ncbi:unnamed protein product [Eruca vesicaria subsp. sativa]|uniref:Cysteine/Histidine-rich C1 domain family protein n=1 Tax=Eruca vesicaria subsp. sativa TaxID=29727 RepID=A0ABC8J5H0_ERUVS|nr:unnamed protein product [Eruca vesicaria subsp. sativa]
MESELITLISQLVHNNRRLDLNPRAKLKSQTSVMTQIISTVSSLDLELQPKKSDVITLISQIISHCSSMLVSEPDRQLVSLVTQMISLIRTAHPEPELVSVVNQILTVFKKWDLTSELGSLLDRLFSITDYSDWDLEPGAEAEGVPKQLISLFPQLEVELIGGKFCVTKKRPWKSEEDGKCNLKDQKVLKLTRGAEETTHFFCRNCRGRKHEDCKKAPVEVKHPLHPRHSLQLVLWRSSITYNRQCYCCDEGLKRIFYYCCACDFAINIACVEKSPVLSVHHPNWHEHSLALFPRQTSLCCNLCALPHSDCPFYICPPCDFVAHQNCLNLPRVIRISRHHHRLSFTPSFDHGDWSCGVCRKKIHNDYGGYSCTRNGCSYAAHSKCATQSNIWDGQELEGIPEEDVDEEGVLEPFVMISNGIILHFSHQQHHLRLDENADRDYDENRICEACITPIYFGNFYSCMQCNFILHEECAKLSRKMHHPIHPHLLTLVTQTGDRIKLQNICSACPWLLTGFFYECGKEGCNFKLHIPCATISEPLIHGSHRHPLFLTSKPGERRKCAFHHFKNACLDTFNCIECEFSLCFMCATTRPQKVRYKHDKHMFTLSYVGETSNMTNWCEACEGKITPDTMFYSCDESCSVTLHVNCLTGLDEYMKPGLLLIHPTGVNMDVLRNNCMSRPICKLCEKRCPYQIVLQCSSGSIFCSIYCVQNAFWSEVAK